MNAVQEPITSQPLPAEHTSDSTTQTLNEAVVTQPLSQLNHEIPDDTPPDTEEEKKRRKKDCCYYAEPDDIDDCYCAFWLCRSIGRCTESCCDCCADTINDFCNGNEGCCEGNEGCCVGNEGCCECNDGCCDGNEGCCDGSSGGDGGDCCDCSCGDD